MAILDDRPMLDRWANGDPVSDMEDALYRLADESENVISSLRDTLTRIARNLDEFDFKGDARDYVDTFHDDELRRTLVELLDAGRTAYNAATESVDEDDDEDRRAALELAYDVTARIAVAS